MKVAFFLLPKKEVAFIYLHSTMRQALEKMEYHGFAAVPLINREGLYVGTLTEGDLLWKMKQDTNLSFEDTYRVPLNEVVRRREYNPIHIDAEMDDIISTSLEQNFVPIVDDLDIFIGIITRREIIEFLSEKIK